MFYATDTSMCWRFLTPSPLTLAMEIRLYRIWEPSWQSHPCSCETFFNNKYYAVVKGLQRIAQQGIADSFGIGQQKGNQYSIRIYCTISLARRQYNKDVNIQKYWGEKTTLGWLKGTVFSMMRNICYISTKRKRPTKLWQQSETLLEHVTVQMIQ